MARRGRLSQRARDGRPRKVLEIGARCLRGHGGFWMTMWLVALIVGCRQTRVEVFNQPVLGAARPDASSILTYGAGLPVRSFDPNGDAGWCEAAALLHARLFTIDLSGRVVGDLVADHRLEEEGHRAVFLLRDDAYFHDDTRVDASDVVATMEALARHATSEVRSNLSAVKSVRASGRDTVIMELHHPFPELSSVLTELAIWPAKAAHSSPEELNANPIGAGPYRLIERSQDGDLFRAHAKYHLGTPGVPYVFLVLIEDDRQRAAALARGAIDVACIKPESLDAIDSSRFHVQTARTGVLRAVPLDVLAQGLSDPRVRRALSALVDRPALVKSALLGYGRPAWQWLAPENVGFDPELDRPSMSPTEASVLLDEAGYRRSPADGLRRRADGTPLTFRLVAWQGEAFRRRAGEALVKGWRDAGIDARVVPVDHASYTRLARDLHGHGEGFVGGWGALLMPASVLAKKFTTGGAQNRLGFSDPAVDLCLETALRTERLTERVEALERAQRLLRELVPWIPLVHPQEIFVTSRRVEGLQIDVVDSWYEFPRHLWRARLSR